MTGWSIGSRKSSGLVVLVVLVVTLSSRRTAGAQSAERFGEITLHVPDGLEVERRRDALSLVTPRGRNQMSIDVKTANGGRTTLAVWCASAFVALGGDARGQAPQVRVAPNGWEIATVEGAEGVRYGWLVCARGTGRSYTFHFGARDARALEANGAIARAFLDGITPQAERASEASSATVPPGRRPGFRRDLFGEPSGVPGLYVGIRSAPSTRDGSYASVSRSVLVLFADGSSIDRLPAEGFDDWDLALEKRSQDRSVVRWSLRGGALVWTDRAGREWIYARQGGSWQGSSITAGYDYVKVPDVSGLRLEATYARSDFRPSDFGGPASPNKMWTIVFHEDGSFIDDHEIKAIFSGPTQRPFVGDAFIERLATRAAGTYRISNHTLCLRYDDGRTVSLSFYVPPRVPVGRSPSVINVGGYDLAKR